MLQNLCGLLSVTAEILKTRGPKKRLNYMKAMLRLDNQTRTKYMALQRNQIRPSQEESGMV